MSGQIGYELMRHAKPVTIGEFEQALAQLQLKLPQQQTQPNGNLFDEVLRQEHEHRISPDLD
ncbi:hypothetical protein VQ056_24060 [Paenibacillus sp. JTLBN-2024]